VSVQFGTLSVLGPSNKPECLQLVNKPLDWATPRFRPLDTDKGQPSEAASFCLPTAWMCEIRAKSKFLRPLGPNVQNRTDHGVSDDRRLPGN